MAEKEKKPRIRFKGFAGEWENKELSHLVDVRSGRDYKHLSKGNIPVYGTGGYMLSVDDALSYNEDAVGIGRKGTIDKPFILQAPFWTVDTLFYTVPKDENDLNFIYDVFQKINWKQKDESTGVPSLSKVAINGIQVFTTKLNEQTKIGEFFKQTDNLITLHQRKYDKLVNVKKSMLEKMFPKDGADVPEIRFKGFAGKWETKRLEETVEFLDERRKPLEAGKRVSGSYPYYGASGIIDYVNSYIFDEELILLSEDGANIVDRNYRVCFIASGKYWVNNHAHVLRAKENHSNGFLCESLERINYKKYNTGTAQPKLNQEVCRNISIMIPKFEEQKKIREFLQKMDNMITMHRHELEKLKNIKKACLEKMFV